ncbi:type II secretion system protein F [Clostridia bacterium]|nr:type II secretion system protein F [Clostridia bacterium]
MAEFSYVAVTNTGQESKGRVSADSEKEARGDLKRRGLLVIKIDEQGGFSRDIDLSALKMFQKKPKPRELSIFCRQFVSIIGAGIPIVAALEMLEEQTENKALSMAIAETRMSVKKGESLSDSMRKNERVFGGKMFISLVTAGEASGSLDVSFSRMAEQFEKDVKINDMVKKASVYPIVILVVLVGVIGIMLVVVIPSFVKIFDELGSELPAVTVLVINMSNFMIARWYVVLIVAIAIIAGLLTFRRSPAGREFFSRITIRLPVIGPLVTKTASARTARTLGTLMASGIPLIQSLEIAANTMTNVLFRNRLLSSREDVAMGNPLSDGIRRGKLYPTLVPQMMKIGEESGNMDAMLSKIADYYDEEVEAATERLMALLEPAIIVLMALVVGFIVIAVMSPMVSMYSQLDQL